jgi:hypothetical protein
MKLSQSLSRCLAASCVAMVIALNAPLAQNAQPAQQYEPEPGQRGKDVIWLPTALTVVNTMLDVAKLNGNDYLIDLGSGDGRTVITAAKRGAKAHGIEYNPDMVALSQRHAAAEGVSERATFTQADLFQSDFSQATVLTMFLLPTINMKLRPTILDMKPGTRVVSNTFDMGDWEPDDSKAVTANCTTYCRALLWIVPAKVQGTWQLGPSELRLDQHYQVVSGTLKNGNVVAPLADGKLNGDAISFTAAGVQYTGRVNGNSIEGTSKSGSTETKWQATRK